MPRNQQDSKDVDNGNSDEGREARGPALNRVLLVGRLAADPELRYAPSGSEVAQLRLATNESEELEFHHLSAWGKVAEFTASYLQKGRLLYVEGRLHWSSWQAADVRTRMPRSPRYAQRLLVRFAPPANAGRSLSSKLAAPTWPAAKGVYVRSAREAAPRHS